MGRRKNGISGAAGWCRILFGRYGNNALSEQWHSTRSSDHPRKIKSRTRCLIQNRFCEFIPRRLAFGAHVIDSADCRERKKTVFSIHQLRKNFHCCRGDLPTRSRGADLVGNDSEFRSLRSEPQNRQQKVAAVGGIDPFGAKDQMGRTATVNCAFAIELRFSIHIDGIGSIGFFVW